MLQSAHFNVARVAIRYDTEMYAILIGIPPKVSKASINHNLAALVLEEDVPFFGMAA